jgi:hypothetical protein
VPDIWVKHDTLFASLCNKATSDMYECNVKLKTNRIGYKEKVTIQSGSKKSGSYIMYRSVKGP